MSAEVRSVGHDDNDNGRRANCNDDRRWWRMDHAADLQMGWKQKQRITLRTKLESRCLLQIEVLDTMIDDEGENQLRLGVIYLQIG